MKAIVLRVGTIQESKYGGQFIRATFLDLDEKNKRQYYGFYCYLKHTKSARFLEYLKPSAIFDNLSVIKKDGQLFIDGNSDFNFLGIKNS